SIVAGRDEVGVELLAERPELAELQPGIADDARVGRAAGEVLVGKVIDDAVELGLEVESVERDVEPVSDAAGIAGVDGGATAFLVGGQTPGAHATRLAWIIVDAGAHEQADHVVPLPLEQHGRDGAIHAPRHCQYNPTRHEGASEWKDA